MAKNDISSDVDIAFAKTALRLHMRRRRAALEARVRAAASSKIARCAEAIVVSLDAACVAVYLAQGAEVDLHDLVLRQAPSGRRLLVPVGRDHEPGFIDFNPSRHARATSGPHLSRSQTKEELVPVEQIDLLLLPGLAYDQAGRRLGQGGGWYDRLLPQIKCSLGICFEAQIVAEMPWAPHDCAVDGVLTEARLIDPRLRFGPNGAGQ